MIGLQTISFTPSTGDRRWLRLITIYHILIGLDFLFRPLNLFNLSGLAEPLYAFPLQMMGVGILVLGIGLVFAQEKPYRHALILALLFISKVLGCLLLIGHVLFGTLPVGALWFTGFNDLLWLPFLGKFLWKLFQFDQQARFQVIVVNESLPMKLADASKDQHDRSLAEISNQSPTLLVFLRHFGCTFCRETMADLARERTAIEANGTQIVVVHISTQEKANAFFAKYNLADLSRIADPEKQLYQAFELSKASFTQAFGWRSWIRGVEAGLFGGHWVGKEDNDGWQMPGVFLIHQGVIRKAFRHTSVADRPDY